MGVKINKLKKLVQEVLYWIQGKRRALKKRKQEVLSCIQGERLAFETMMQRVKIASEPFDNRITHDVLEKIEEYEQKAKEAKNIDELDDLLADAQEQGQLRAYICPFAEIRHEADMSIDRIEEWNVPKEKISKLRNLIENAKDDPKVARSALRSIYEEYDSWNDYTDHYEDTMSECTFWLFFAIVGLLGAASLLICCVPLCSAPIVVVLLSGMVGSCVSVMAKMPTLEIKSSGELVSYRRLILVRIGTGSVASLIGCGLLGWGVLPISIQGQTFADILNSCTVPQPISCTGVSKLIYLAVPMIFGFSERALASFEHHFVPKKS
ncbi:MAG: hypothetical protein ACOYK8_01445 [Alphaproteobacteria bacterium]